MLNHYSYKIQANPSIQGKFTNNSLFTFLSMEKLLYFYIHLGSIFLFSHGSASQLFLKADKGRRTWSFLPLPDPLDGVTIVQVIEANDISWMLVRGSPGWEFFLP